MDPNQIQAIDVHAHYGRYTNDAPPHAQWCMSADAAEVAARARAAQTQWTIVSPMLGLFPRGHAEISDTDKRLILRENDARVFGEKLAPFLARSATPIPA